MGYHYFRKPPFPPNFFVTLFGMVKTWPFSKVVGDLQLGDEKKRSLWITWKFADFCVQMNFVFFRKSNISKTHCPQKEETRRISNTLASMQPEASAVFVQPLGELYPDKELPISKCNQHILDEGCQVFFYGIIFNKRWTYRYFPWFGRKCRFALSDFLLIVILLVFPSHLRGTNRISEIQNCTMHGILEKSKSRLNSGSRKIGVFTDVSDWMRC